MFETLSTYLRFIVFFYRLCFTTWDHQLGKLKCILCNGEHPAPFSGCSEVVKYNELIMKKNPSEHSHFHFPRLTRNWDHAYSQQQNINIQHSYANFTNSCNSPITLKILFWKIEELQETNLHFKKKKKNRRARNEIQSRKTEIT